MVDEFAKIKTFIKCEIVVMINNQGYIFVYSNNYIYRLSDESSYASSETEGILYQYYQIDGNDKSYMYSHV